MDDDLLSLLGLGLVSVLIAVAVLSVMVRSELGPLSGLTQQRYWLLAVALGSGVIAFSLKLLLIVIVLSLPEPVPEVAVIRGQHPTEATGSDRYLWQPLSGSLTALAPGTDSTGYVWQPLPTHAPGGSSPALAVLGEQLFHDKNLSRDRSLSCASCHDVRNGAGDDGLARAVGIDAQVGPRNTPTVWNAAFQSRLFWDGRAHSLEEQALGPLLNPAEMGMPSLAAVVDRVTVQAEYREAFSRLFGHSNAITIEQIAAAMAAYERTLVTPDTPYDRFVRGDLAALTPAQLRGMALFASVGCVNCHSGPNFSAASRFDGSAPLRLFPALATPYEERYHLTEDRGAAQDDNGRGVWRVPSLRNVALTAPYFHNGSVDTLEEAVRVMASVQLGRSEPMLLWSERERVMRRVGGNPLSDSQVSDLVAFLHTLSSDRLLALQQAKVQRGEKLRYAAQTTVAAGKM